MLATLPTYEQEGALFVRSTSFGDDKDRVLVRSAARGGTPTYEAADVAYLRDKLERGYDRAIYVLGADHHGVAAWYPVVARMLGYDAARVEVLLYQLVHLTRGGEVTKMSKRRGDVVFLDELMDEAGVDFARWFLVDRGHDQTIEIDVDLAAERSRKNPVYYVQYVHARISGIFREAPPDAPRDARPTRPLASEERELRQAPRRLPCGGRRGDRAPRAARDPGVCDPPRRRLPSLLPRAHGARRQRGRGRAVSARARRGDANGDRSLTRPDRRRGARADVAGGCGSVGGPGTRAGER